MARAQAPEASRGSLEMLFQQLAQASAVGLINLRVPETGRALPAKDGAAASQPVQQSNGQYMTLERPQERLTTRGQPRTCAAYLAC